MPRRNTRASRAPHRSSGHVRGAPAPVMLEKMVIPRGRCPYSKKLRFALSDADKALQQARDTRARKGQAYHEERWYQCPSCGDAHLTSRREWTP